MLQLNSDLLHSGQLQSYSAIRAKVVFLFRRSVFEGSIQFVWPRSATYRWCFSEVSLQNR